jgi:phage terminase small subunit
MNVLTTILTVAAIGLGAMSLHLHFELQAARAANGAAHSPPNAKLAGAQPPSDSAGDTRSVGADQEQSNANSGVDASVAEINRGDVRTEPAEREVSVTSAAPNVAMRARAAAASRRLYGGLAHELGLLPEQEAQVLQVLIDQQTEQLEMFRKLARDPAAMNQAMTELRDRNQTELMIALGDRYLAFEDYQKSLGERMQIEQAALQLEAAGVPLRDDQRRRLLDVMVDERDQAQRPAWNAGTPPEQMMAQLRERQDEYDRRVRSRLSGVLSSEQLKQYDVYRNLQSTLRRRQLETWRESTRQPLSSAPSGAM